MDKDAPIYSQVRRFCPDGRPTGSNPVPSITRSVMGSRLVGSIAGDRGGSRANRRSSVLKLALLGAAPLLQRLGVRGMEAYCCYQSGTGWGGSPFREDVAHAANFRSDCFQLFFDIFVATVQVIDAVNDCFTVSHQGGEHE
jgi:hypothetical protein